MDELALIAFAAAAAVLLGTPGPGIAALVAAGRAGGLRRALPFFWGVQAGLAVVATACAMGLAALVVAVPGLLKMLGWAAAGFLLWMAWQIAKAVPGPAAEQNQTWSFPSGLLLGLLNPKSMLAFLSLFASQTVISGHALADSSLKLGVVILMAVVVDLAWLTLGAMASRATLRPAVQRMVNLLLAVLLAASALMPLVPAI